MTENRKKVVEVRVKPEVLTEGRMRMEMRHLDDEDIENTVRMKGWAWVLSRKAWVYAGEPDFIFRQIREIVITLPNIKFEDESIEESVHVVLSKTRSAEEREEGRELLRRAFEKTGQPEGFKYL
ncbi:hypothetical protein [Rubrobacter indicoceani]|uniref:hypothetical protein n=1 Tax=Rubrobacter indicoceani TaxID=2051957 RepID=UPI000E5B5E02|nr:hypothetical protein [Rubrobacter indicoceani]